MPSDLIKGLGKRQKDVCLGLLDHILAYMEVIEIGELAISERVCYLQGSERQKIVCLSCFP